MNDESLKIISILSKARFVGGCVRDSIIKKEFTDIDIATVHTPEIVTKLLEKHNIKVIPTGIKYGTVTAVLNGKPFEITTLRKDVLCDGRHAEVNFTDSWEEDAARRDFTMNALSMDSDGKIYDYFNGKNDLEKRVVRFVGDPSKRIKEDYLRILRLFRFHAWYGKGKILQTQLEACVEHSSGIQNLSGERIQSEMLKILSAPNPLYVLGAMKNFLKKVIPSYNIEPLELLIDIEECKSPYTRLAVILKSSPEELAELWKLSKRDARYLADLTGSKIDPANGKKLLRLYGKELFIDKVLVTHAIDRNIPYKEMLELANEWKIPQFPLRGKDFLNLGFNGKEIGVLLKKAEKYWEDNDYTPTKDDLLKGAVTI